MRRFYTGIDIGTHYIKVVVAAPPEAADAPMHILATATTASRGMRHGYIVDMKEVARAIHEAAGRAAQSARVPIKSARIAMGGVSLEETRSGAEISLTPSGGIVHNHDIERVLAESEKRASARLTNRTVIHVIPLEFRLDGALVQGRPSGLQGTKLGVESLLVTMLAQHHDDLIDAVEAAGIEVEGVMASPLAASLVTLTKAQKTAGVVLANVGAETLSIVVFDNDIPISLKVFPIGSSDITHAIALSFQVPLLEAEQLKRGAVTGSTIPAKRMESVIGARMKDMFALINAHLKSIGRDRLLPAGIVITGGGAGLGATSEIARAALKIPAQIGLPTMSARISTLDATWAVALGLCRVGFAEDRVSRSHAVGDLLRQMIASVQRAFRSFLP